MSHVHEVYCSECEGFFDLSRIRICRDDNCDGDCGNWHSM